MYLLKYMFINRLFILLDSTAIFRKNSASKFQLAQVSQLHKQPHFFFFCASNDNNKKCMQMYREMLVKIHTQNYSHIYSLAVQFVVVPKTLGNYLASTENSKWMLHRPSN